MLFIDRQDELSRLERFGARAESGLAVLYGRRRIGKTRLLLEWSRLAGGLYTVADQSAPEMQRRYFAEAVGRRLRGFDEVDYPDWRSLLSRLARDAAAADWQGPLIFDELPYLVAASPELPSVLQRFLDHEAKEARLKVAVAGSSQRMMQGLVLAGDAPLYGRAHELMDLGPLDPVFLPEVFELGELPAHESARRQVELYAAWGGVPRYWELASELDASGLGDVPAQLDRLALDPLGPLHLEPDRLLIEELPPATEARPILDAIGGGSHRLSEIGGRMGRPATSLSRPIDRLIGMGLVHREVPFGESAKSSKRSLYRIADPFVRLWFRAVAPYRAQLTAGRSESRRLLLERFWPQLSAEAFEQLCRLRLPRLAGSSPVAELGPWGPAGRWWRANQPEWDLVAESMLGERILLGEVKWRRAPYEPIDVARLAHRLARRPAPQLPKKLATLETHRALFVPATTASLQDVEGVLVLTARDLLARV